MDSFINIERVCVCGKSYDDDDDDYKPMLKPRNCCVTGLILLIRKLWEGGARSRRILISAVAESILGDKKV